MKGEEKLTCSRSFRLGDTLDKQLDAVAKGRSFEVGELIRLILEKAMSREQHKFNCMQDAFGGNGNNV